MPLFNTQLPNEGSQKPSVNTRGLQLYNSMGIYHTTIRFGFWNDTFMTIGIAQARPKELQTDHRVYDYDHEVRSAINASKVLELLENYDRIAEAYKKDEDADCYVELAGSNLAGYGTKKVESVGRIFFFALHRNLDDHRIPAQSAYYQFNQGVFITNYDIQTGDYKSVVDDIGEFKLFRRVLEKTLDQMAHGVAHSIRVVEDWKRRQMEAKIDGMATKLGVPITSGNGFESEARTRRLFDDPRIANGTMPTSPIANAAAAAFSGKPVEGTPVAPPVDAPPNMTFTPEPSVPKDETITKLPDANQELPF